MSDELYAKLVCALMHNMNSCEVCRKCGYPAAEARMNIIKEIADECDKYLPWDESMQPDEITTFDINKVNWRRNHEGY